MCDRKVKLIPCTLCLEENIVYMESSKHLERAEQLKLINFLKQRPPCKLNKIEIIREELKCENLHETVENIPEFAMKNFLDLWKKFPCLWHEKSRQENGNLIQPSLMTLTRYFNEQIRQDKTVDWVRELIEKIRYEYLSSYHIPNRIVPWYHEHMTFLLQNPTQSFEPKAYANFECNLCLQRFRSQENLVVHLYMFHLRKKIDPEDAVSQDWAMETVRSSLYEINEELGKESIEEFISAYKKHPCLWDWRCDDYLRQGMRVQALQNILEVLRQFNPDAELEDVVSKIEYLRTQFNQEHENVKRSMITGVEYTPTLWYYKKMEFILNQRMQRFTPAKIGIHYCSTCNKLFSNPFVWWYHTNYSHQFNDGLYTCQICGLKKDDENLVVRHMRFCHLVSQNYCNECKINFPRMSTLAKHRVSAHNDICPYRCSQCGVGFRDFYHAELHFITHWYVDDRRYSCGHCEASFSKHSSLNAHVSRHYRTGISLGHKMFHNEVEMMDKNVDMFGENKPNTYICTKCKDSSPTMMDLMLHRNQKHGIKRYPCRLCEREYDTLRNLHYHFQKHNPISDHECYHCGMKFVYEFGLVKHIKHEHRTRKFYDCTYCVKKLPSRPMLQLHMDRKHRALRLNQAINAANVANAVNAGNVANVANAANAADVGNAADAANAGTSKAAMEVALNQANQCMLCGEIIVGNTAMLKHIKGQHHFKSQSVRVKQMDVPKLDEIKLRIMLNLCKQPYKLKK